jgi:hypothetical protein
MPVGKTCETYPLESIQRTLLAERYSISTVSCPHKPTRTNGGKVSTDCVYGEKDPPNQKALIH